MNHFSVLIRLLRDRKTFLYEVGSGIKLETKIASLLVASSFFFSVYGAIIGSYGGGLQIISSAIKLPALYLITLIICIPTLYFFDILFGSKLDFKQYVTMALTSVSVISVLLFSFAPVVLFFLISVRGYNFFLLLNVLIMAITGGVGVRLFYKGNARHGWRARSDRAKLAQATPARLGTAVCFSRISAGLDAATLFLGLKARAFKSSGLKLTVISTPKS